jgi:hypothetical protein
VCLTAYNGEEPGLAQAIGHELNLPDTIEPISILPLGYPDEVAAPKTLPTLADRVHIDRF